MPHCAKKTYNGVLLMMMMVMVLKWIPWSRGSERKRELEVKVECH